MTGTSQPAVINSIQILPGPPVDSRDFFTADPHGCLNLLQKAYNEEINGTNNRLLIGGDLVSRGPDSFKIIQFILAKNQERINQGFTPQIYAVRGNHEQDILTHLQTGRNPANKRFFKCQDPPHPDEWINALSDTECEIVKNYILSLPIILKVEGHRPRYTVHGDMPCDDATFAKIQAGKLIFSENMKRYCLNARPKERKTNNQKQIDIEDNGRTAESILALTGHNTLFNARPEVNTVCADVASPESGVIALIDTQTGEVKLIGEVKNAQIEQAINTVTTSITPIVAKPDALIAALKAYVTKRENEPREYYHHYLFFKKPPACFMSYAKDEKVQAAKKFLAHVVGEATPEFTERQLAALKDMGTLGPAMDSELGAIFRRFQQNGRLPASFVAEDKKFIDYSMAAYLKTGLQYLGLSC